MIYRSNMLEKLRITKEYHRRMANIVDNILKLIEQKDIKDVDKLTKEMIKLTVTKVNGDYGIKVNGSELVYDPKYFELVTSVETLESTHESITKEMYETYKLKNEKYGDSFGISFRKFGMMSALVRISDKYNRMEQLILNDDDGTNDESLEDTMLDMANYLIMAVMEKRNKHDEEQ